MVVVVVVVEEELEGVVLVGPRLLALILAPRQFWVN